MSKEPVDNSPEKDEHLASIQFAQETLSKAEMNLKEGRKRLQNAIDRYKERAQNGPSIKPF